MADKVTKIIEVELSATETVKGMTQLTEALNNNKKTLKELEVEYKAGKMTSSEFAQAQVEIKTQNKLLNDQLRTYQTAIVNNIKQEQAEIGSLNQLRAAYNSGKAALAAMSEEERNSAKGQELIESLREQKSAITEAEERIGDYTGNVGNYERAIKNLPGMNNKVTSSILAMSTSSDGASIGIKALTTNIWTMTKAALAFIATPIGAVIAAIVVGIKALSAGFSSSEANMNRFNALLAPLKLGLDAVVKVLQNAVSAILTFSEGVDSLFGKILESAESIPKIGKYVSQMNDEIEKSIALEHEIAAITKQAQVDEVQNAKDALEVSKLRKQAKDIEKYTAEERLAFLDAANKLEEEKAKRNVELKERELAVLQEKAERNDNDAAAQEEKARKEAEVYNAQKEYFDKTGELQEQSNTLSKQIATEEKARNEERLRLIKEREEAEAAALKSLKTSQEELYQLTLSMQEKTAASEKEALQHQTNLAIEEIETRLAQEANITEAEREVLAKTIVALREKQAQDELKISEKYSKEELSKRIADKQQEWDTLAKEAKLAAAKIDPSSYSSGEELKKAQEEASKAIIDAKMADLKETFEALQDLSEEEQKLLYDSAADYNEAVLDAEIAYNSERIKLSEARIAAEEKEAAAVVKIRQSTATSVAGSLGTLASAISSINDENREAVIASQTLALAEVAINQGVAIAKATSANSTLPFPANIAAVAASVAAIVAQIVSATSTIKSASFSEGGYVSGEGTSTSDSIPANLSNGEYVVNAAAVSALGVDTLDAINSADSSSSWVSAVLSTMSVASGDAIDTSSIMGMGSYSASTLKEAMKEALRELPSPIVSVVDINTEQKATSVRDNIAKLK